MFREKPIPPLIAHIGRLALRFGLPLGVALLTWLGAVRGWGWPGSMLEPFVGLGERWNGTIDGLASRGSTELAVLLLALPLLACALAFVPGRAQELRYRVALALLAADATASAWTLAQRRDGTLWLVATLVPLGIALAMAIRWRRDPAPRGTGAAAPPWPWELAAGLALALGALLAFSAVDRDVGTNFYSHWQDWEALERPEGLRSLLSVSTATARTSMDSGPYRAAVHLAFGLFGASWTTLRALSATCFAIALALAHGMLRRRLSAPAAVGGVLLLATSPLLLDLAHVPSFLGPSVLLGVATVAAYDRWLGCDGERGGVLLGLLLWIDLYGFAPLRPLIALLPLAAAVLLLRRGRHRFRARLLLQPGLALGIPLLISLAATGADPARLVYADGEFLPTSGLASEDRFRVIDAPDDGSFVAPALAEVLLTSGAGWWPGPNVDDGVARPLSIVHAAAVVLGLIALAVRGLWRSRTAPLLALLIGVQLPLLALVYPVALRRMAVWFPCLLLAAAGGLQLLLGGRSSERGVRGALAGGALLLLTGLLVPHALASLPRLASRPTDLELSTEPCLHQRTIADRALAGGDHLIWAQGPGDPTATWSLCHPDVLGGNWAFYRWRECRDGGGAVGRWIGDPLDIEPYRAEALGVDAPVYALGRDDWLLFMDPDHAGATPLGVDRLASDAYLGCE